MKAFFSKKYYLQQILIIFPFLKFFLILEQILNSFRKKTFSWNSIFWYAFYSKIATFTDFENSSFFEKKNLSFFQSKNPKFRT